MQRRARGIFSSRTSQKPTPSLRNGRCRRQGSNVEQLFQRMLACMLLGGIVRDLVSPSGPGSTTKLWIGRCSLSRATSNVLLIARATYCLVTGADSMNNCSPLHLVYFSAITHIGTLRSPKAMRMFGIRFCHGTISPTMPDFRLG
jgi:hypothetical protein